MSRIKIELDLENGIISVEYVGAGIPTAMHSEHGIYVPELIFGNLLTSSNYDDTRKKVTGGRNGFGAKLANIFSKRFTVGTVDSKRKLHYSQTFTDSKQSKEEPRLTPYKRGKDLTK